jgi:hypothetical protein
MERISMRTILEVLSSFDFIITTSIMQSDDESMSVSVNRIPKRENQRMSMRIDLGLEFL